MAAPRRVHVRALPDEEDAARGERVRDQHPGRPRVRREQFVLDRAADEAGDELGRVFEPVVRLDPRQDRPPDVGQVKPPDHARDGRVEHPVLDRGPQVGVQVRCAEHHVEVGPGVGPPDVLRADLLPGHAGRTVGAEDVVGLHPIGGAGLVADGHGDAVVALRQPGHRLPQPQVHVRGAAGVGAQHLLDDRLRHLLARLGEPVITLGREPERAVEGGDALPGQGLAEHHPLRPRHRQRRGCPQLIGQTPPAQVLHGPHARGLGPRTAVRDLRSGLDHHAVHAPVGELRGGGEPGRPAPGDQYGGPFDGPPRSAPHCQQPWLNDHAPHRLPANQVQPPRRPAVNQRQAASRPARE